MKSETLVYSIGCTIVIVSSVMKILHLPYSDYSNSMLMVAFVGMSFFQAWHVAQLKKRIKELESK